MWHLIYVSDKSMQPLDFNSLFFLHTQSISLMFVCFFFSRCYFQSNHSWFIYHWKKLPAKVQPKQQLKQSIILINNLHFKRKKKTKRNQNKIEASISASLIYIYIYIGNIYRNVPNKKASHLNSYQNCPFIIHYIKYNIKYDVQVSCVMLVKSCLARWTWCNLLT